ncbi:MAG: DUF4339 domain-containing protein [Bdellovibrionota bacterium]
MRRAILCSRTNPLIAGTAGQGWGESRRITTMPAWYVQSGEGETGPYTDEQMRVRAAAGAFSGETQVRPETSTRWIPLAETEFGGALPRARVVEAPASSGGENSLLLTPAEQNQIMAEFKSRKDDFRSRKLIRGALIFLALIPLALLAVKFDWNDWEILGGAFLGVIIPYLLVPLANSKCPHCDREVLWVLDDRHENSRDFLRHCPRCGVRLQ